MTSVIVIGASIGAVRTAQAMRAEGFDGRIALIGEESELPYDKPPLSKGFLAGAVGAEEIGLLTVQQAKALDIELLLGERAESVDTGRRLVVLEGGDSLKFDHLVVASGARPRPSPWGQPAGLHVLRSLRDARTIRQRLLRGGHVVVVGGGFIGSEVASTSRSLGLETTLVDPLPAPMSRVLDRRLGEWFIDHYRRHGVSALFGVGVADILGRAGKLQVHLTDGSCLDASTVVVGIGAVPNVEWLESSGLAIDDGLVCDQYCRALGTDNVFGVGDAARWFHPGYRKTVRVEHWTNAVEQANCVAHNIVRPQELRSYAPVEYVWSDQHDWKIQMVGRADGSSDLIIGNPAEDRRFAALFSDERGQLNAALAVNWPRAILECRRAISGGEDMIGVAANLEARLAGALGAAGGSC